MIVYCPKSRTRLEVIPSVDSLDANAVIDHYENGELTERAFAILSVAWNVGVPEPHEAVTGLMFDEQAEPFSVAESLIHKSNRVYRITELDTLGAWIIALGDFTPHILLYQM